MMFLVQRETQTTLLAAVFRVLILLISATPYDLNPHRVSCFSNLICHIIDNMLDDQVPSNAEGVVANCHYSHVR